MADTSHLNVLFQAEFNTALDLADVMRFIHDRCEVSEILEGLGATEEDVAPWVCEKDLLILVGVPALYDPFDDKSDAIQACLTMIEAHNINPDDLFTDDQMREALGDFNE